MINTMLSIPVYSEISIVWIIIFIILIVVIGIFMLLTLLAGILSFIDKESGLRSCLFGAIVCGVLMLLSIFMLTIYLDSNKRYPEWYESEIVEVQYDHIYSLNLENEVSGHFFLGSGKIGTDTYYYFYIKNSYDAYQLTKIKVDGSVYLKESDETPKVIERKEAKSAEIYTLIYVPIGTVVDSGYSPY